MPEMRAEKPKKRIPTIWPVHLAIRYRFRGQHISDHWADATSSSKQAELDAIHAKHFDAAGVNALSAVKS